MRTEAALDWIQERAVGKDVWRMGRGTPKALLQRWRYYLLLLFGCVLVLFAVIVAYSRVMSGSDTLRSVKRVQSSG